MTSPNKHIQYLILDQIVKHIKEGLLESSSRRPGFDKDNKFYRKFQDFNREQLAYKVFNNFRLDNGVPKGIRLSYLGNELLKRQFTAYDYSISINPTPKMYLTLDNHMRWPYYFTKKKMVFYDAEDSAWFKLNGSDISAFIDVI
tara:strand:+ start:313 stop:744 length:432 start_codon:yes stop_codon:yes gene_type:complete